MLLHWLDLGGEPKLYGEILPGGRRPQQTRPGAAWLITDSAGRPLGHFLVGDRSARAEIPEN